MKCPAAEQDIRRRAGAGEGAFVAGAWPEWSYALAEGKLLHEPVRGRSFGCNVHGFGGKTGFV